MIFLGEDVQMERTGPFDYINDEEKARRAGVPYVKGMKGMMEIGDARADFEKYKDIEKIAALKKEISKVIIGQDYMIDRILIGLLTG